MYEYEQPSPAVVYFDPKMTEVISYGAWKFTSESKILLRQIQLCIYEEMIKCKKSVFMKLEPAFEKRMKNR